MCEAICDSMLEHCAMWDCVALPNMQLSHLGGSRAGYFLSIQWTITLRSNGCANVLRKLAFPSVSSRFPAVASLVSELISCISDVCNLFLHFFITSRCCAAGRACKMVNSSGSSGKIFLVIFCISGCISFSRCVSGNA